MFVQQFYKKNFRIVIAKKCHNSLQFCKFFFYIVLDSATFNKYQGKHH